MLTRCYCNRALMEVNQHFVSIETVIATVDCVDCLSPVSKCLHSFRSRIDSYCLKRQFSDLCNRHLCRNSFLKHFTISSNFVLCFLLFFLITFAKSTAAESCRISESWEGTWFSKGLQDRIKIQGLNISEKGICRTNSSDKFLIENRAEGCVRCMFITQKHRNVLQYKETPCFPEKKNRKKSLNEVCGEIQGDAHLYSLFRADAKPEKCPFTGRWKFSYSRGQGDCKDPMSIVESCTDNGRLVFKFQACADVQGSESREEKLECYADWKDGAVWYLVGRVYGNSRKTDEDRFRCFVYDKNQTFIAMAQSSDASCDNLLSPTEGSVTMRISESSSTSHLCEFPTWIRKTWKTLDSIHFYDFTNDSFSVHNSSHKDMLRFGDCVKIERKTEAFVELVVHSTFECKSGFVCMKMFKRSNHIVEIQFGEPEKHEYDACQQTKHSSYITLASLTPELNDCPLEGVYSVNVPEGEAILKGPPSASITLCSEQSNIISRCERSDQMQLHSKCNPSEEINKRNFVCHDGWQENGTHYLIISSTQYTAQYCLTYSSEQSSALRMTLSSTNCRRHQTHPSHGSQFSNTNYKKNRAITFDLVSKEMCNQQVNAANFHINRYSFLLNFISLTLIVTFVYLL